MNRQPNAAGPRVLAIVPALNEAATIQAVVRGLRALDLVDVLVVDDGSSDDTASLAKAAGAAVLSLPTNLGIGAALRGGFLVARERRYSVAFQFDADGQHLAPLVDPLLAPVRAGRADLVVGSRFAAPSNYDAGWARRLGMRLVGRVVRHLVGAHHTDPTSGFRAFSGRAVEEFARSYPTDYLDSAEALVLAYRKGLRVEELPVQMRPRAHGASSAGTLSASWNLARAVFAVYAVHWRLRRAHPR